MGLPRTRAQALGLAASQAARTGSQ